MIRSLLLIFICIVSFTPCADSVRICSWNIKDFGRTKDDSEIRFICSVIKDNDIVMLQEVVAGPGEVQAVARLAEELNRTGTKWDYTVSDPTFGASYKTERYAYLWKPSRVKKIGDAWLEQAYRLEINREPYFATFSLKGKEFTLVNFHAITKSKQPETEVKYFRYLPGQYPNLNLIFCGDFNLPQSHSVFNPLQKMGYIPALRDQKTTLKLACRMNDCLASEFDNVFYCEDKLTPVSAGIIPFYQSFASLKEANAISDHVPIYFQFVLK